MKGVIEGWITRDRVILGGITELCLHTNKPIRRDATFHCIDGDSISLPKDMFPQLTWENAPKKVKITIETIEE